MIRKGGQVWVETVIYTLIGLAIIGLVLAAALPKINAKKDDAMIEQSIEALGNIDNKVYEVLRAAGNRRVVNLEIRKGYLIINMSEDSVSWILDSSFMYSEEDMPISIGRLNVTTRRGKPWEVELKLKYDMNVMYNNEDIGTKRLDIAPTPYKFTVENMGKDNNDKIIINFNEA